MGIGDWFSRLKVKTRFLLTIATTTKFEQRLIMTRMYNPPHPGEVLKEYLGDVTVTEAARRLGVGRVTLQRIVNGAAGISPDMAYRLASAFGTNPELWAGLQLQYDLYLAGKIKRPKIEPI